MRSSYFVLYSAVLTQAATALLLACALYVLGRYYPRHHLRLWGGAWVAEAAYLTLGIGSVMLRAGGAPGNSVGMLLTTWMSQLAGYLHGALLLMGAWALYRQRQESVKGVALAIIGCALLALLPTFAVPHSASPDSSMTRLIMRLGVMSAMTASAAVAAAFLVRRASGAAATLGVRWTWAVLLVIGMQRAATMIISTSLLGPDGPNSSAILQALPLIGMLLTAALGIGTAIAR